MRHIACLLCAGASLTASLPPRLCAQRPHYGGSIVIETRARVAALDPAADGLAASVDLRRISAMVYEGLVRREESGEVAPALAVSWTRDAAARRWEFALRPRVRAHDGSVVTAAAVAAALAPLLAPRAVIASGDRVVIQSPRPDPGLPGELAEPRHWVVLRNAAGAPLGTGPFRVTEWLPNLRGLLAAHEAHWQGRPFLDGIEVRMGRALKDQLADLEAGRADVVELSPAEMRRQQGQRGRAVWSSAALDLVSLVFMRNRPAVQEERVRRGLALAVDRPPMLNVLLQKQGESSGALVPQWLSGHAFVFPAERDLERARQLLAPPPGPLVAGYDAADPLLRLLAERIALNAREAGVMVRVSTADPPDMILTRVSALTLDPARALEEYSRGLQMPAPETPRTAEALYQAERRGLAGGWVLPLFHVPSNYGLNPRLRDWAPAGALWWRLDQVWLEPAP